ATVEPALARGDRTVRVRQDPGRGALEDVQALDPGLDLGDELDRRGAGADGGHPLAGEVVVVVPAGRVKDAAVEALEPGQVGDPGLDERSHRRDEDACGERAVAGLDAPAAALLVPGGAGHLAAEPDRAA